MSEPTMPAALAELLREPGWERHNVFGNQWTYRDGDLEIAVIWPDCWLGTTDHIAVQNIGWGVPMSRFRRIVTLADRIEAALTHEGGGMRERDLNRTQKMAYAYPVPDWERGVPLPWKPEPERQPVAGSDPGDRAAFVALLDRWGVPYEAVGQDVRIERHESGDDSVVEGYAGFFCDWEFTEDGRFVRVSIWE